MLEDLGSHYLSCFFLQLLFKIEKKIIEIALIYYDVELPPVIRKEWKKKQSITEHKCEGLEGCWSLVCIENSKTLGH